MDSTKNFFRASAEDFKKIPGSPVAYWVSERMRLVFSDKKTFGTLADVKQGIIPGNVESFVRHWYEVANQKIGYGHVEYADIIAKGKKWFLYNKGGSFRRWYGNFSHVINMENNGDAIKNGGLNNNYRLREPELYFKKALTWSKIGSGSFSARFMPPGLLFDIAGCCIFSLEEKDTVALGFLNSKVVGVLLGLISPTLNYEVEHIKRMPTGESNVCQSQVCKLCDALISSAHSDWDAYETSWDFAANPLIAAWNLEREKAGDSSGETAICNQASDGTLQGIYEKVRAGWAANCEEMRRLETENNRIFIEAYGLQDELTPEVPWHEITLTCNPLYRYAVKNDELGIKNEELEKGRLPQVAKLEERLKADTVKELVSYAVGCMMGRYAIDKPGLVLANQGATYEDYLAQISEPAFAPDDDGIIPILEDDCFADDIVTQFHRFLRITFGERNFNANLSFIEDALGKDLRSYFVKDFYADHLQRYQKRPIYWLFSSPKGTFSALIYLHRYHPGTVGQVLGYLRSHITKIQSRVDAADRTAADPAATQGMKTRAIKERAKLVRQLKELEDYERDVLHPLAGQRIEIDLDDGVKANYPKFGKALRKIPRLE